MLRYKFDIDADSLAYDGHTNALAMTVRPLVASYDEGALFQFGWGVMAGCRQLRRLVVKVELEDTASALGRLPLRRVA
ncbi:hypothetical protein Snov_2004 [Ancylobacter novellus DSM 506]|uniref:Uncharacterized protein n=1 Tax=Ancylobacter novellus (strain ATCC 8093 / DSM 506 / JCM 20403 / CCM 1077 / IAM 12100 / NBRC 12443 / NCIMB 10456) TaxID=639283 RepID=D7A041_ANCN5|nr:hypothetical protein [Ancylobacter novellus]ADH89302.1 hypothetical protein Snov_2004 [Ancylobacter novellus DSM 506]